MIYTPPADARAKRRNAKSAVFASNNKKLQIFNNVAIIG